MLKISSPHRAGLVLPLRQTVSDAMGLFSSGRRDGCRRVSPKSTRTHLVELGPNPGTKRLSFTDLPLQVGLPPEPWHAQRLPHVIAHIRSSGNPRVASCVAPSADHWEWPGARSRTPS